MRAGLIACLILCSATVLLAGEPEFPYTVYIAAPGVTAHSGPGDKHYPTGPVPVGEAVEVWRHGPDGWLAIRPPSDSFSWVAAKYLKLSDDGIATVTSDRVPARVGSAVLAKRDVVQVRLKRGEEVEVLERVVGTLSPDRQEWCKIAPPAGEFRWIPANAVSRIPISAEKEPAPRIAAEAESDVTTVAAVEPAQGDNANDPSEKAQTSAAAGPQWKSSTASGPQLGSPRLLNSMNPAQINLALTQMAADEPNEWIAADLRHHAEVCLEEAQTPGEREYVQSLIDRIARFEHLQRSYTSLGQPLPPVASSGIALSASSNPVTVGNTAPFDATGRLTAVVSRRPGAPGYALVTGKDQVQYFVTPAPGVNLQPYLGQTVGVYGQRGFVPELNKPHVTASRVSVTRTR